MGIESEQLVLDYLSRVGDLAHGTSMTAAERAKLIGGLRSTIEQRRARVEGVETAASVRKLLKSVGRPEDVVASASGGEVNVPQPRPNDDGAGGGRASVRGLGARLFGGRPGGTGAGGGGGTGAGTSGRTGAQPYAGGADDGASAPDVPAGGHGTGFPAAGGAPPPHLAGMDELTAAESDPYWWRNDPSPYAKGSGGEVDGFVGGIEIPEMLKPPPKEGADAAGAPQGKGLPGQAAPPAVEQDVPVVADAEVPQKQGLLGRIRGGSGLTASGVPRAGGVVELAAVLTLAAGAVLGNLIALGVGWLLAWWSPRLSRNEAKWAAAGMPGLVAIGTAVWLWGRAGERWGEPIADGALGDVLNESYPWVLRAAAGASALFLLWRARRPR